MNAKKILLILGILVILTGLIVSLLFVFIGLYKNSQDSGNSRDTSMVLDDPIPYLKESWHFEDGEWDPDTNVVTAIKIYDISYEDAKKIGSRVFTDDLAPETYLSQALTIAADLSSRFSIEHVTVEISFRGNDGQEIFSVDSTGNIITCWNNQST